MRILAVTELSGYMTGGPTTAATHLLRGLSARGHEVGVVVDRMYPGTENCHHFPSRAPLQAGTVAAAMQRFQPDVVHVLAAGQRTLVAMQRVLVGKQWLVTMHSLSPSERIFRGLHYAGPLHYLARDLRYLPNTVGWKVLVRALNVPRFVVHSQVVQRQLQNYGCDPRKITVIDLACDLHPLAEAHEGASRCDHGGLNIVTISGIAYSKGIHDGIRAIAALRHRYPGIRYRIIGEVRDPTYLGYLRSLISRLHLESAVEITPNLPEAEKLAALRGAHLYLQPSHEEGFCLAYLEAASLVPRLIGTETGAIPRISAGDPLMRVVPVGSPAAIASTAEALLTAASSDSVIQNRLDRLTKQFSWSRHCAAHVELYQELLA